MLWEVTFVIEKESSIFIFQADIDADETAGEVLNKIRKQDSPACYTTRRHIMRRRPYSKVQTLDLQMRVGVVALKYGRPDLLFNTLHLFKTNLMKYEKSLRKLIRRHYVVRISFVNCLHVNTAIKDC